MIMYCLSKIFIIAIGINAIGGAIAQNVDHTVKHDQSLSNSQYEAIYTKVQTETDQGRLFEIYMNAKETYLKRQDSKSAFIWAVSINTCYTLWQDGYAKPPKNGFEDDLQEVRKLLLEMIKNEKASGYPFAEYARFVQLHREPLMAPKKRILVGKGMASLSNGKKVPYEHYKVISDEPRDERVKALVEKALAIEPDNKFALFMLATVENDPTKAINLCWKSIDRPGKRLWEFNALAYIKKLAKNDKETVERVDGWAARAKAIVGDSVRAKSRGF